MFWSLVFAARQEVVPGCVSDDGRVDVEAAFAAVFAQVDSVSADVA